MKQKTKKNAVSIAIGIVLGIPLTIYGMNNQEEQTTMPTEVLEAYTPVDVTEATTEILMVTEETTTVSHYYASVNLDEALQEYIASECQKYNISEALVLAIIERESDCKADCIGDDGSSVGLMQVQQKWHQERMESLGCEDLLDPYENVTVGINYLAELFGKNPDLYWVLMAYNGGEAYANARMESGNYSDYAVSVAVKAAELERR